MKRTIVLGLLALLAVAPAFAGQKVVFEKMHGIPEIKAWGMAEVGVKRGVEYFDLRADVSLPNGSWLLIEVNRADGPTGPAWLSACKAEVVLGTATCRLNSKESVSPVFPIRGLSVVMVRYKGKDLLKGRF